MTGEYAYGFLQTERGVHRLVRISPFDSNKRRHTCFASVDVVAEIDDTAPIEINPADLESTPFVPAAKAARTSTRSKLPCGSRICRPELWSPARLNAARDAIARSAMKMLKSKLYANRAGQETREMERQYGEKGEIAWGNQIRCYVFQPYRMVKDQRTGVETSNVQDVMDGDIDMFIQAKLRGEKATKGDR